MDGSLIARLATQCSTAGVLSRFGEQARMSGCCSSSLRMLLVPGKSSQGEGRLSSAARPHSSCHSPAKELMRVALFTSPPPPRERKAAKNESTSAGVYSAFATESLPQVPLEPVEQEKTLALPLDLYQVLGADTHFLADAISRAYEARVANPLYEGFSIEACCARREILQAARDTLTDPEMRGQYNQGLVEDESGTIVVDIPWSKVAGALCILLEIGETEIVLQAGQGLLLVEESGISFRHDVLLAMALAYVELSREAMTETPPAIVRSCDHLDAALSLLQGQSGGRLAPGLQVEVSQTLEELRPQCVLELLALSLDKENEALRADGVRGLRNLLWTDGAAFSAFGDGSTRDEFMKEAFVRMTALEQVELYNETPVNIPAEPSEVYTAALAHVAEGFAGKKPRLIKEADTLFSQMQQTNGYVGDFRSTDRPLEYSVERAMCALLLGEVGDCRAWLDIEGKNPNLRDPSIIEFVYAHSEGLLEGDDLPGLCKLLEGWLSGEVFPRFREMDGLQVTLGEYYDDPVVLEYLESSELQGSPLAAAAAMAKIGQGAGAALDTVKATLQRVFPLGRKAKETLADEADSRHAPGHDEFEEGLYDADEESAPILVSASDAMWKDHHSASKRWSSPNSAKTMAQIACSGLILGALVFAGTRGASGLGQGWRKIVAGLPPPTISLSPAPATAPPPPVVEKRLQQPDQWSRMDASVAERLIRKWQTVKARALGPNHSAAQLPEILDGEMLRRWSERAEEVGKRGWFWEYKLLDLNIESVTLSPDGRKAMVEATLKEYARLYDNRNPEHNDSYKSSYMSRYEFECGEGGWRITGGAVLRT